MLKLAKKNQTNWGIIMHKKISEILLIVLLIVTLYSCGEKSKSSGGISADGSSSGISADGSSSGGSLVATALPLGPNNSKAQTISSIRIDLSWDDNSDNEAGFKIERAINGSSYNEIATLNANVISYSDNGLSAKTTYNYRICAYNSTGNSSYSNIAQATTDLIFYSGLIIADHTVAKKNILSSIPESAISHAKANLHIGYGHTSHGSQITDGMSGLIAFANGSGSGLSFSPNIFSWSHSNNSPTQLHFFEGAYSVPSGYLERDCGYYPDWVNETTEYLGTPDGNGRGSNRPEINVIMWAWCGQVIDKTEESMLSEYLQPMANFENTYPGITFVYMTGHAVGGGESGNVHIRNQQIRNYCIENKKVLFDFYDIECYDPDDSYYGNLNVNDDCSYTGGNWATQWQGSHTEGEEWYSCNSAHSQPLNANRKAYAIWWLFARIAGWGGN